MNGTAWTKQQITDLRLYYAAGIPCRVIGKRLGRTQDAVIEKARKLGLPPHPLLLNNFWTEQQTTDLLVYWANGVSCRTIAKCLGKTRSAVIGKANRMGLPRHRLYGDYGPAWQEANINWRR